MSTLAVARLVRRELLRRPLHVALLLAAASLIVLSRAMVTFGFGEEAALVELSGLETIALYAFAVAVLFGAGSVGRDIESRLLVTILAKPVSRGAYLIGRFLGLVQTFAIGLVPLAIILALALVLGRFGPDGGLSPERIAGILAAIVLILFQAAALAAAVLALSVMLPPSLGLVLAVLIAAGGFLAEPARQALPGDVSPLVDGLTRAIALLLPPISRPAEGSEIAFGAGLPLGLILVRILRSTLFAGFALILATWRLGRKDLT